MGRWIPYLAGAALLLTVAVVVYKPGDPRLVGVWVLDVEAVGEGANTPAEARLLQALLEKFDFRFEFSKRRVLVGMTTDSGRTTRGSSYRIVRESERGLVLEMRSKKGKRPCEVEFTDRGIVLHWHDHTLPLRRP